MKIGGDRLGLSTLWIGSGLMGGNAEKRIRKERKIIKKRKPTEKRRSREEKQMKKEPDKIHFHKEKYLGWG